MTSNDYESGTTMLDYCPLPSPGFVAILNAGGQSPSSEAAVTALIECVQRTTLWIWNLFDRYTVCAIVAVLLADPVCCMCDFFPWPQRAATTTNATASIPQRSISSLPIELLVQIMDNLNPGRPGFNDLHRAMRVCWTWRRIALAAPRLWCTVKCAHRMPASEFSMYLWRSKTVPLSVTLAAGASELHLTLLGPHMRRLRELHLGPFLPSSAFVWLLSYPAPELQEFHIAIYDSDTAGQRWRIPRMLFEGYAPLLKDLYALPYQMPALGLCPALANVVRFEEHRHIDIRDLSSEAVANVLLSCPALHCIALIPTDANMPYGPLSIPKNLKWLHVDHLAWKGSMPREGLMCLLDMLPLTMVMIWFADAALIHDTITWPVKGAPGVNLTFRRSAHGGQVSLSSEMGVARRCYVDMPLSELAKTLRDPLVFAGLTLLNMPAMILVADLPPPMPLLRTLCFLVSWESESESEACHIFKLTRSLALRWRLPALRHFAMLFRPFFGIYLPDTELVPTSGLVKPVISARDLVYFVTRTLDFGNGHERLDRLTVSKCLQIEQVGGCASGDFVDPKGLAVEFCYDERVDVFSWS